ncbi:MAG: hypothetical protein H6592_07960 [Flavobacteriales bacterium]|nr:hypothetical protein [Flavobacteriales bacterium]
MAIFRDKKGSIWVGARFMASHGSTMVRLSISTSVARSPPLPSCRMMTGASGWERKGRVSWCWRTERRCSVSLKPKAC